MKAVLSNRIFLEVTQEQKEKIRKELTYKVPGRMPLDPPTVLKNMAIVRSGLIAIPSGREDLIPKGHEIVDKRVTIPVEFPEMAFPLYEDQQVVYEQVDSSCIINAKVSWGKTFTSLAIAAKLGQKTLIIAHNVGMRDQWVEEVKKLFGIEPSIIGSGKFDTSGIITVGNIQTITRHAHKLRKEFGTIILDEMHHSSAPTFSKVIDTSHATYKIGLSGTIERKDGKHVVFRDFFSPKVFIPPRSNSLIPEVHVHHSDVRLTDGSRIPWATKMNELTNNPEYLHTVALLAAAYAKKGYKVLVVSDRVQFLKDCAELAGENAVCITGEVTDLETRKSMMMSLYDDMDILCGTQSIFSEGTSLNCLSCIILATPINNDPLLEQLIGRIVRIEEGKIETPVVIDINLKGKTAKRQASNRIGFYMKEGYQIKEL